LTLFKVIAKECKEFTVLVAIIPEFYRYTGCGADTKQHINGRIRYLKLDESEIKFIKENPTPKKWPSKILNCMCLEKLLKNVRAFIKKVRIRQKKGRNL
jgi:hypothetical protein